MLLISAALVSYLVWTPADQMFRQLKWQSLKERCNYFTALMVFKCLNGLSPTYLQNKFKYVRDNHGCNTRQSTAGLLSLPPLSHGSDIESFKYCFSCNAVNVWNNIETSVRTHRMCNLLNMYIKLIIGTELGLYNIYKGNISKRRVCILVILTIVYILMLYVLCF